MISKPMDVLEHYQVRKSARQKKIFREEVAAYCTDLGYCVKTEKGSMGAQNLMIGDPTTAKYLITAHYDTCARLLIPNFITPCNMPVYLTYQILVIGLFFLAAFLVCLPVYLATQNAYAAFWAAYITYMSLILLMILGPANKHTANDNTSGVVTLLEIVRTMPEIHRNKVCFILFDLEEAGLVGSASYRKAHKAATDSQIILNLDCVGDGDELVLFPTKKLKNDPDTMAALEKICGQFGPKSLALHKDGFAMYPSDQKNFPLGVGIAAFHRNKLCGLYCDRIHTHRDTVLELTNVNILRAALTTLITGAAAE
ncbi:MAG: Zn-dependent exopeptidase M28 [Ruminococcaceae bacterium]|nr:Zn-dependent exopeptidase M28 [Oscillospiraceae bacterium]